MTGECFQLSRFQQMSVLLGGDHRLARFLTTIESDELCALAPDRVAIPDPIAVDFDQLFSGWSIRPSSFTGGISRVNLTGLIISGLHTLAYDPSAVSFDSDHRALIVPMAFHQATLSGCWATDPSAPDGKPLPTDKSRSSRSGRFNLILTGLSMTARILFRNCPEEHSYFSVECKDAQIESIVVDLTVNGISEFLNRLVNATLNAEAVMERVKPAAMDMLSSESVMKRLESAAYQMFKSIEQKGKQSSHHSEGG